MFYDVRYFGGIFLSSAGAFFTPEGSPVPFSLRPKQNTQDDPFDEYIADVVLGNIEQLECVKASGPLITPDVVLHKSQGQLSQTLAHIMGIEVKKLERTLRGNVARSSGLDHNTTPPCGLIRVYDSRDVALDIRCFYLFVCLEPSSEGQVIITSLALVDGNLLNEDFNFYLSIVGERTKSIGLGSYADGANRERPMLIFSNPLGVSELDHHATLIHPSDNLTQHYSELIPVHKFKRTLASGGENCFCGYRLQSDVPNAWDITTLVDPFPTPKRDERTRPRGKFRLPVRL